MTLMATESLKSGRGSHMPDGVDLLVPRLSLSVPSYIYCRGQKAKNLFSRLLAAGFPFEI